MLFLHNIFFYVWATFQGSVGHSEEGPLLPGSFLTVLFRDESFSWFTILPGGQSVLTITVPNWSKVHPNDLILKTELF